MRVAGVLGSPAAGVGGEGVYGSIRRIEGEVVGVCEVEGGC